MKHSNTLTVVTFLLVERILLDHVKRVTMADKDLLAHFSQMAGMDRSTGTATTTDENGAAVRQATRERIQ